MFSVCLCAKYQSSQKSLVFEIVKRILDILKAPPIWDYGILNT